VLLTHLGSLAKLICRNQRRNEKQMNITNKKTDKWERKMKARKYIHIKLQPTKYDDKPVAEYRTIICILYSQLIKCMPLEPLYCILFACKLCIHSSLQTTLISCRNETQKVWSCNKSKHFCSSTVTVDWNTSETWAVSCIPKIKSKVFKLHTETFELKEKNGK
jgi:hypothetical protein